MYRAFLWVLFIILLFLEALILFDEFRRIRKERGDISMSRAEKPKKGESTHIREVELVPVEDSEDKTVFTPSEHEDEMPAELEDLFGSLDGDAKAGWLATGMSNLVERQKIKSEIKTAQQRTQLYRTVVDLDQVKLEFIETRKQLIKSKLESGALSQKAINYLKHHYPGFVGLAQNAQELAELKHEKDKAELRRDIEKLRNEDQPANLTEYYLNRLRREGARLKANIKGLAELQMELAKLGQQISAELADDQELDPKAKAFLAKEIERTITEIIRNAKVKV